MADKDFVVKNGLVVNTNLLYANGTSNRVGINNSNPDASLTVTGTANVSGNVTLTGPNLHVTAYSTFTGNVHVENTVVIDTQLYVGNTTNMVPLGNIPIIQAVDTRNGFVMISSQNLSTEDDACADLLIYADNTGGLSHFNDLGINNSRFDGTLHRISANTNSDSFVLGETLFQSNGSVNVAVGILRDRTTINSTSRSLKISILETDGIASLVGSANFSNTTGANLSIRGVTSGANADILVAVPYGVVSSYSRRNYPFTIGKRGDGYLYNANSALTIGTTAGGLRVETQSISTSFINNANTIELSSGNTKNIYAELLFTGTNIQVGTYITSVVNTTAFKISKPTTGASGGSYILTDPFYEAAGNPIIFHVNGMSANDEIGRISGNGNFTIGNNSTSRTDKLTVRGTANITGNVALANNLTVVGNVVATGNVSSPNFKSGANVTVNTTAMFIGNTIANSTYTSTLVQVTNSTSTANLTPLDLKIGATTVVNSTQITATLAVANLSGSYANITGQVNTATLYAATSANIASAVQANATGVWTTGIVNAASHTTGAGFGAATSGATVNVTAIAISSNTTVNSTHTAALVQVANSTSTANLTAADLKIGAVTVVNSTQVTATLHVGNVSGSYANISGQVNTATLYAATSANIASGVLANSTGIWTTGTVNAVNHTTGAGFGSTGATLNSTAIGISSNSTVNASLIPALVQVANSTSTANLTAADLKIGSTTVVNSTQVTATLHVGNVSGAYANISGQINTATLYATTSANVASVVQANSTGVFVASGNINIGSAANGVYVNTTAVTFGNASVNATINSTNYSGTSNNTQYVGVTAAGAVVNTAQLQGNLALYQTLSGLQANVIKLTANDSAYFANQLPSYYTNATNITTGTLASARISGSYTGITAVGTLPTLTVSGNASLNNFTLTSNASQNVVTIASSNVNIDSGVLFVDSINNRVGINTTTPDASLHIVGSANVVGNFRVTGNFNVTGDLTYTGTTVSTGDFNPATGAQQFNLGNTSNRWNLVGNVANLAVGVNSPVVNLSANLNIGANVLANTSALFIGNASVYTTVNSSYVDMTGILNVSNQAFVSANVKVGSGVVNSYLNAISLAFVNATATATINATNYTGTAANAALLNNQNGAFYLNADNFNAGTIPSARLPAASPTVVGAALLIDSVTNTSTTVAASANSVKNAYDRGIDANTRATSAQTAAVAAYTNAVNYVTAQAFGTAASVTANASAAYTNATTFASNADNISSGTLAYARIPGNVINTTAAFTISNVHTYSANIVTTANINISNSTATAVLFANTTNVYFTGIAWNANNTTTVGGNTAATLRSYSDTMAATAYTNAVSYVTAQTYANTQQAANATYLTTGTVPYSVIPTNIVNTTAAFTISGVHTYTANISTTANVNFSNGVVTAAIYANTTNVYFTGIALNANNAALVGGNSAATLRAYTDTGYTNAVTFASNATNITSGTLGYSIMPVNIVNTTAAFTIGGVHTYTANISTTANINFSNATAVAVLFANTSNVYFTGIAWNANNTTTVGGNTSATLRSYSDTMAATAYTNAVNYVTAQAFGTAASVTANAATAYTNAVNYVVAQSYANTLQVTSNATTAYTNAITWSGNAALAYANAVTFASNATNITSGTLGYSLMPANIVNTTADFTISGVHYHTANVTVSDRINIVNSTVTGVLFANTTNAYFTGIALNAAAADNSTTVGGNTAATLRSYSDTMAATAYSNGLSYVTSTLASYATTASIPTLTSNNATYLGGVINTSYARKDTSQTFSATVTVGTGAGIGYITLGTSGDIVASRTGNTTGVIYFGNTGSKYLYFDATNYQLPGGGLIVGNDITAFNSDARLKTDIVPIANALSKVEQIRGVHYRHNDFAISQGFEDKAYVGVIAQEVEAVLPEVITLAPFDSVNVDGKYVSKSGDNYKTVKYDKIVALLIEAIKELNGKVETLTNEIAELKK